MLVKQITNENFAPIWDKFVAENSSPASFLQSWQWGKFRNEYLGKKILRYAIFEGDELMAVANFEGGKLPGGKFYLDCTKGPIFKKQKTINNKQRVIILLVDEIKKIAKEQKVIFIRFQLLDNLEISSARQVEILKRLVEPNHTALLDLNKSEEEILAGMHEKTRYNIRLAEKRGVEVRSSDIDNFYNLLKQTAKRDKIKIFGKEYYQKIINCFINELQITNYGLRITLLMAEYENMSIAGILVLKFGDTTTYLHGGSSNKHRDKMPSYALQWAGIKWAKEQGCQWYDFWGVAKVEIDAKPEDYAGDRWAGITRFKLGFLNKKNGLVKEYPSAKDLVLNNFWYNLYRIGKFFKR